MANPGLLLTLSVLTALAGVSRAQYISEHDLYGLDAWRSDLPCVVVREQENVHLIEVWLEDTNVPVFQVKCDAASGSDLCTLLSLHAAVVRKEGRVLVGVVSDETDGNNTVASVMENLLLPQLHLIEDYSVMKEFQETHPRHMLAYARSHKGATFDKYLYFLKALLSVEDRSTHVAVTKQPLTLPLSNRPKFSKSTELFLWLVSDGKWCQYGNSSLPIHIVDGIAAFYRRIKIPLKVRYTSEQLTSEYQEKGLFTSYVIHSPANKKLAERVVSTFIETYCNFFVFLIAEKANRRNKLTKALYLSAGENNIIIIEPPNPDMHPIHLDLLGIEEQDIVSMLAPIQEEYMQQYLASQEAGKPVKKRRQVVVTDPRTIGHMAVDSHEDMLVAFCDEKNSQVCGHFENSLQKVADIITTSAYQRQEMGFAVVRSSALEDVRKYGVEDYPYIAYYNVSDGRWSEVQENNFQEIINRALGKPEESEEDQELKKEMEKEWDEEQKKFLNDNNKPDRKLLKEAEKISREYRDPSPPDEDDFTSFQFFPDDPPPSPPPSPSDFPDAQPPDHVRQTQAITEEDDHFGQLSFSLGPPDYPEELVLSDETFGVHINSHTTSMVTFFVPWEPHCDGVMYYMLQALEDLPENSGVSLAVVNCADYPDLCSRYGIIRYPTIFLFRGSPNDWTPYKGMMDSRRMLNVLLDRSEDRSGLLELTPETLPLLIPGGVLSRTVLVVWAGERGGGREGGEDGVKMVATLADSEEFRNFSFAWIDCKDQEQLLQKVFQDFKCESLLLFDFQQRSVYQLSPTEWQSQESLTVTTRDFLSRHNSGTLSASGYLTDWAWPPLQPPITFPSRTRGGQGEAHEGQDTPPPPPPFSSPLPPSPPPFTEAESSPPPPHHAHTEL